MYRVHSPVPCGVHPFLTVRSLMVEDYGVRWNAELVRGWFTEEEADLILSIPLSLFQPADLLIWAKDSKGLCTTKSAYFVPRSYPGLGGEEPTRSILGEQSKFL